MFGYFCFLGMTVGLWAAGLPALNDRLQLGPARLGTALLLVSLGALLSMLAAGHLVDRWSSGTMSRVSGPLCALALLGPALAPDHASLAVAAVLLGLCIGVAEVAVNAHSVEVERLYGRPVISAFHGAWSLGAAAGGALTSAALSAGIDPRAPLIGGALAIPLLYLATGGALLPPPARAERTGAKGGWGVPWGLLLLLGVAAFAGHLAEGAAMDWAALHTRTVLDGDPALAPLAFTIFSAAMTAVRFLGDPIRRRLGNTVTVGLAGTVAATGYGLVLLSPLAGGIPMAWTGWGLTGVGLATVIPVLFSAVGAQGVSVGKALSTVTAFGYTGLLLGPAVLGFVAEAASLRVSLFIPALFAVVIALTGVPSVRELTRRARERTVEPV